ncbi:MAG TPA: Dickkopf N-terminal cysteine-rich domain-containing protein [Polyangia bacterium]|nr:Dickkopf N-terminal cysteine-rich domain-containing protein [Polyangia bacterium]
MRRFSFVLLSVVAVGCGGGSGGAAGGPVALDKFPTEYAKAVCPQNVKCCSPEELMMRTEMDCETNTSSALTLLVGLITSSQSKGRVVYHADKMGECIKALGATSCDAWKMGFTDSMGPDVCRQAFEPKVANGNACGSDIDCTSGHCLGDQAAINGMPAKDGMCVADVAGGGTCDSSDSACASGNYCDFATKKCAAQKAQGMACNGDDECTTASCGNDGKCGPRSCYLGCSVAGPTSPGLVLVSVLGWASVAVALSFARRRRGRRRG